MTGSGKQLLVKGVISISLMTILFLKVDLSVMKKSFLSADPGYLVFAVILSFAAWMIATLKWQWLLAALGVNPSYGDLLSLNFISIFYSFFLPGQISSEIAKGIRFAYAGGKPQHAVASITIEKLTGLAAMLLMGIVSISYEHFQFDFRGGSFLGIAVLACCSLFLIGKKGIRRFSAADRCARVPNFYSNVSRCFEPYYRKPGPVFVALLLSFLFQFFIVLINYMVCLSLAIPISFFTLIWIVASVGILRVLPISIAGIGVREGGYVFLLGKYGIAATQALSFSLLILGISLILAITGGLLDFLKKIRMGRGKELS
jgi:uncharacterized protein (TIRG00374 family)